MANYRVLDDNNTEIFDLFIPNQCVVGSTYEGDILYGVGSGAFKDCVNLTSVEFQDACTVGVIGDYGDLGGPFENCTSITEIILNADDSGGEAKNYHFVGAFKNCSSLSSIDITGINFSNINSGFELSTESFFGTGFSTFNLPYVHVIGTRALGNCSSLTRVETDAYSILGQAFYNSSNITTIVFKNSSLNSVGTQVFYGLSNLTNITFYGTIAQWEAINKANGWYEELAFIPQEWADGTYKVHCSDGDTPLVGGGIPSGLYDETTGTYTSWEDLVDNGDIVIDPSSYVIQSIDSNLTGKLVLDNSVYGIANNGFENSSIDKIVFNDNIPRLGNYVFKNCSNLEEVDFGNAPIDRIGLECFYNCTSLTDITIPNTCTSIGQGSFYNCTSLREIDIPSSCTSLGMYMFLNCTSLERANIQGNITNLGESFFSDCTNLYDITLPNTITAMGSFAFKNTPSLTSITLPSSLETIGYETFYNSGITSITLPSRCYSVGSGAFENCTDLTTINTDGLTHLGENAFKGCTSLTGPLDISSVVDINEYTFDGCTSLTTIIMSPVNYRAYDYAFYNSSLTSITYDGLLNDLYTFNTRNTNFGYQHWKDGLSGVVVHCTNGDFTYT